MKQVKGMTRTVLAAVAFMLLGFAFSTSAVAQDIPEPAPQDIPEPAPEQTAPEPEPAPAPAPAPTSGPGVDQLIGAIQDAEAQTAALGEATDLTVDKIQLVSVQDILQSEDEANAVNEVLTASGEQVMALQAALGANPAIQEALGENVSAQDVLAIDVLDDGGVVVFHQ